MGHCRSAIVFTLVENMLDTVVGAQQASSTEHPMSFQRAVLATAITLGCAVSVTTATRRQSAPLQSALAAITGTVVTVSSAEPIADASVSLYASVIAGGHTSTITDAQGRFQFSHLGPGHYTVGAEKAGFVHVVFGERYYGRGGRAIPLRNAEQRDIRIQLPHTNIITGRIVDERGNAAARASVRALRFSMAYGYRRPMSVGMATTDNRGIFRIESLTPGDYVVCASTPVTAPLNDAQRLQMEIDRQRRQAAFVLGPEGIEAQKAIAPRLAALEAQLPPFVPPVRGYAPTCYPSVTSTPLTITLAPNEERSGVDMQFALTRLARIEGIVKGMAPEQQGFDPIILFSGDDVREGMGQDGVRPNLEGRFSFANVTPGRYKLVLRGPANGAAGGPPVKAAGRRRRGRRHPQRRIGSAAGRDRLRQGRLSRKSSATARFRADDGWLRDSPRPS